MSRLSKAAKEQIRKSPFGDALVEAFEHLEEEMVRNGGVDMFVQMGFIAPGEEVQPGDLIPTLHLSLKPHDPILSSPVELVWDDNDDG